MTLRWKSSAIAALAIAASASSASQAHERASVRDLKNATAQYNLESSNRTASTAIVIDPHSGAEGTIRSLFAAEANERSSRRDRTYYFSKELRRLWSASEKRLEAEGIYEGAWGQTVFANGARPLKITKILSLNTVSRVGAPSRSVVVDVTAKFENPELLRNQVSTHISRIFLVKEENSWRVDNIKYLDQKPSTNPRTGKAVPTDLKGFLI